MKYKIGSSRHAKEAEECIQGSYKYNIHAKEICHALHSLQNVG